MEPTNNHRLKYTQDGIAHDIAVSNRLDPHFYDEKTGHYIVSGKQHVRCREIKEMLTWWKDFATTNSVDWVVTAGSLLGAVRHNGLIPWDNDLDIAVHVKNTDDRSRLFSLCGIYENKTTLTNNRTTEYYEVYVDCCGIGVSPYRKTMPKMDVFLYENRPDGTDDQRLQYGGPYSIVRGTYKPTFYTADTYPKYYHMIEDLEPIGRLFELYEGIDVPVPHDAHNTLKRWYGPKCLHELFYDNHVENHDMNWKFIQSVGRTTDRILSVARLNPSRELPTNTRETNSMDLTNVLVRAGDLIAFRSHDISTPSRAVNDIVETSGLATEIITDYMHANLKRLLDNIGIDEPFKRM